MSRSDGGNFRVVTVDSVNGDWERAITFLVDLSADLIDGVLIHLGGIGDSVVTDLGESCDLIRDGDWVGGSSVFDHFIVDALESEFLGFMSSVLIFDFFVDWVDDAVMGLEGGVLITDQVVDICLLVGSVSGLLSMLGGLLGDGSFIGGLSQFKLFFFGRLLDSIILNWLIDSTLGGIKGSNGICLFVFKSGLLGVGILKSGISILFVLESSCSILNLFGKFGFLILEKTFKTNLLSVQFNSEAEFV